MATIPSESASVQTNYRASAGLEVDPRRVGRFVIACSLLILVALAIATTIGAVHQNSVESRLRSEGVPVEVTVTGCGGTGSAIGQGMEYYVCRGSYDLDGHRYNETIGGSRGAHPVGQTLKAVAVPGHPDLLSSAAALAKPFSRWTPFITPIVLAAVAVALALLVLLARRRGRSSRQARTEATAR